MALEAIVFQQDPLGYVHRNFCCLDAGDGSCSYGIDFEPRNDYAGVFDKKLDSSSSSMAPRKPDMKREWEETANPSSLQGKYCSSKRFYANSTEVPSRRKRPRTKTVKNKEDLENQRMTHIAVERNRRKQMNDYLSVIRSMMPASYVQRGDQASIVAGAINFVKELEQLLQTLEANKRTKHPHSDIDSASIFTDFLMFPQYSSFSSHISNDSSVENKKRPAAMADVEVTMVESHANVKVLSRRHPRQLLKMVAGLQSLRFTILHLNVTTIDQMSLISLSLKVEEDCQLTTVNELAAAVYEMVGRIEEDAAL